MISFKLSRKILKVSKIKIGEEYIKSSNSINRVTATDVFSKTNNPAGNNAAFDGFAVNSKDTNTLSKKKINYLKY